LADEESEDSDDSLDYPVASTSVARRVHLRRKSAKPSKPLSFNWWGPSEENSETSTDEESVQPPPLSHRAGLRKSTNRTSSTLLRRKQQLESDGDVDDTRSGVEIQRREIQGRKLCLQKWESDSESKGVVGGQDHPRQKPMLGREKEATPPCSNNESESETDDGDEDQDVEKQIQIPAVPTRPVHGRLKARSIALEKETTDDSLSLSETESETYEGDKNHAAQVQTQVQRRVGLRERSRTEDANPPPPELSKKKRRQVFSSSQSGSETEDSNTAAVRVRTQLQRKRTRLPESEQTSRVSVHEGGDGSRSVADRPQNGRSCVPRNGK